MRCTFVLVVREKSPGFGAPLLQGPAFSMSESEEGAGGAWRCGWARSDL